MYQSDKMTSSQETNKQTFDQYYDKPAWWFRWRYDTQVKRKTIFALLNELAIDLSNKRVFELGFGSGAVLFSFPRTCELYGVEISTSAVEKARVEAQKRGYLGHEFVLDKDEAPFPVQVGSMDIVVASHVLEHVEDLNRCLEEIWRILGPEGRLVVLVPINERFADLHHVRTFTFERCRQACEEHKFKFLGGFENELLYYLVEKLYWNHSNKAWGFGGNIARITFNLLTARLPFWIYRVLDRIVAFATRLPPRQAGLVFSKETA